MTELGRGSVSSPLVRETRHAWTSILDYGKIAVRDRSALRRRVDLHIRTTRVLRTVAGDPVGDPKRMLLPVIVRSIQDLPGSTHVYSYSVRKATTGSIRRALRAGIAIAAKAVNMRMTDTPMNVNGSVGWTPNSI